MEMAQKIYPFMLLFQTPLHIAAGNGKDEVLEILLWNGADINEKNARIIS
jgi:hypothetical protein